MKTRDMKYYITLFILILLASIVGNAKNLSMNDFLNQVEGSDQTIKSSKEASEGAKLRSVEGELITLPNLSINATSGVNQAPSSGFPVAYVGDKTVTDSVSATINEQTDFGLNMALGYTYGYQKVYDATLVTVPEFYKGSPSLTLTQSLWRNGFGSETREQKEQTTALANSKQFIERFRNKSVYVDAKNTFLKLFYARKSLQAIQTSLAASQKLKDWSKQRSNSNLADTSDYLQTKAAYEARELDLAKTQMDERSTARYLNSLRGVDSDTVEEDLVAPPPTKSFDLKKETFSESNWRDDVKSAIQDLKVAKAGSALGKEKNTATVNLTGSYALNSLDPNSMNAFGNSFQSTYPVYSFGVTYTTPLAFGAASDTRSGYEKEVYAADLNLQRKFFEQVRDYKDLTEKLENASKRLRLAQVLEASQKAKLENERKRHRSGRTTLFNVLQYEQDYVNSQLNTINTEIEFNSLLNQLEFYQGGNS